MTKSIPKGNFHKIVFNKSNFYSASRLSRAPLQPKTASIRKMDLCSCGRWGWNENPQIRCGGFRYCARSTIAKFIIEILNCQNTLKAFFFFYRRKRYRDSYIDRERRCIHNRKDSKMKTAHSDAASVSRYQWW